MSRQTIPLATEDLSAFARQLAGQLKPNPAPGHVELPNRLPRAAGFRNYQHLRAASAAKARLDAAAASPEPSCDQTRV